MSDKYILAARCIKCGYEFDIGDELHEKMQQSPREPISHLLPSHCGEKMRLHNYRPTRFQYCYDNRCRYGQGIYCSCTCEGTFHGVEAGATERGRYTYFKVPAQTAPH